MQGASRLTAPPAAGVLYWPLAAARKSGRHPCLPVELGLAGRDACATRRLRFPRSKELRTRKNR